MVLGRLALSLLFSILVILTVEAQTIQPLDSEGLPSKEFTLQLMESNPELVVEMVRKLYSIEHAIPVLTLPDLKYVETKDGNVYVGYNGVPEAVLTVGDKQYVTMYEFSLAKKVLLGYKPIKRISFYWFVGGGLALFFSGVVVGLGSN